MTKPGHVERASQGDNMSFNKVATGLAVPVLVLAHMEWIKRVSRTVPDPYLDEVFHTPQANAFWQGNWSHWDDKITTPPGVYLWSILTSKLYWADTAQSEILSAHQTRSTNNVLPYMLAISILVLERSAGRVSANAWVSPRQLCVFAFPMVFFFSGLYYTDVFSALTVMSTYAFWQSSLRRERGLTKLSLQSLVLLSGLVSLASRQTNIFWIAIFPGGLQLVHTIKKNARIHDPLISEAYFEDFFTMLLSLATSAFGVIPALLLDLWPQLALLSSFAAFVVWNGGVVLGDKSNHVATVHLPQMLYIWPFILFFSWPVLLPYLTQPKSLLRQVPRYWLVIPALLAIAAVVHFNTIVHPFLLADNRHYTFYVFKILRTRPWLWYALVPVYAASAWLAIVALGGIPVRATQERSGPGKTSKSKPAGDKCVRDEGNRLSFLLVWLISMALSLVTAPLVEPRYFIVPWLIWRLHVPQYSGESVDESISTNAGDEGSLTIVAKGGVWIELLWYMLINFVTCRLFLEHQFRWPHSPTEVQRFMW